VEAHKKLLRSVWRYHTTHFPTRTRGTRCCDYRCIFKSYFALLDFLICMHHRQKS